MPEESKTATQELAEVCNGDTERGRYAEKILMTCPRLSAKNVLALADMMLTLVADAVNEAGSENDRIVPLGAHIPTTWDEYPNGRVGLDSVGNIAEVHLDDAWEVA